MLAVQNVDCILLDQLQSDLYAHADPSLMRILFDNLLGNAWNFTSRTADARIEFRSRMRGKDTVFFVKDNGAGFDMAQSGKLFQPFQRGSSSWPGLGGECSRRGVDAVLHASLFLHR
jgi:signal transduction histidine kinase